VVSKGAGFDFSPSFFLLASLAIAFPEIDQGAAIRTLGKAASQGSCSGRGLPRAYRGPSRASLPLVDKIVSSPSPLPRILIP